MALRDFWISVRTGASLMSPWQVISDAPRFDAASFEEQLHKAHLWLTPSVVAGFNAADFDFLPKQEQAKLEKLVTDFRKAASQVNPKGPATDAAVNQAAPLFRDIVQLLGFDRFEDPEAYVLGRRIEEELKCEWPMELEEIRFRTGLDHTGDPGLWLWAIVKDEAAQDDEMFLQNARKLRPLLKAVAQRTCPDRWPYLSFRSLAEQLQAADLS